MERVVDCGATVWPSGGGGSRSIAEAPMRHWEDPEGNVLGDEAVALLTRELEPARP